MFSSFRLPLMNDIRTSVSTPTFWLFTLLWIISAIYLMLQNLFNSIAFLNLLYIPFILLTFRLTEPQPVLPASDGVQRRQLWFHVVIIVAFIIITAADGLVFHRVIPGTLPVWSDIIGVVERFSAQTLGNDNYLANPLRYFVLPLIILLLAGAKWRELGLGSGHRVWQVTLLWCALPLIIIASFLLNGQTAPTGLLSIIVSNSLQNGFMEEFLFRGALQTRLRRLLTPGWAIVITSLVFGVWHLGLGFTNTGGDNLMAAIVSTIVYQALLGLAFAWIFERTRNLIACSIVHVIINTLGQIIS